MPTAFILPLYQTQAGEEEGERGKMCLHIYSYLMFFLLLQEDSEITGCFNTPLHQTRLEEDEEGGEGGKHVHLHVQFFDEFSSFAKGEQTRWLL